MNRSGTIPEKSPGLSSTVMPRGATSPIRIVSVEGPCPVCWSALKLRELERTLDGAVAAYGSSTRFPLYDTEFGYHTDPPETGARPRSMRHSRPTT
jgi:hypothetical protein